MGLFDLLFEFVEDRGDMLRRFIGGVGSIYFFLGVFCFVIFVFFVVFMIVFLVKFLK